MTAVDVRRQKMSELFASARRTLEFPLPAEFRIGDVFERLAEIPDGSIDLVVTSPPFLALRSYLPDDHPDKAKEIGSEPTPAEFLDTMLALTAEWGRVLAPHGSICVELGDTYSGSGGAGGDYLPGGLRDGQQRFDGSASKAFGTGAKPRPARTRTRSPNKAHRTRPDGSVKTDPDRRLTEPKNVAQELPANGGPGWPLDKSMCLIPHLYTIALAYGINPLTGAVSPAGRWRVRNVVCWARPNPPVGALGDKFRPATSYITVACRARDRYFDLDAVRGKGSPNTHARLAKGVTSRPNETKTAPDGNRDTLAIVDGDGTAPPLDWHADDHPEDGDWLWRLPTRPYKGAHHATYPEALPKRLIEAMCPRRVCTVCGKASERIVEKSPEYAAARAAVGDFKVTDRSRGLNGTTQYVNGSHIERAETVTTGWTDCGHDAWRTGIVLDPFAGSGTTLAVAVGLGRHALGIDIDDRNAQLASDRVGMFLTVTDIPQEATT